MGKAYRSYNNREKTRLNLLPAQRFDYLTKIYYDWAAHLSSSETVLLGWIMANTIGRDFRSGYYSLDDLVNGVGNHKIGNKGTTGGTGLSRSTVCRTIAKLEKLGVIKTYPSEQGKVFTVVLDWDPTAGQDGTSNVVPPVPYQASRQTFLQEEDEYLC